MSALLQAPGNGPESDGVVSDHKLVALVRRGDDRAFEALYERYHRRIHAYVYGMVKDHQRAEDVTQEVFVSALRRMRATERPIAFKPWIYEIAKNACIDQFRRSKRAEEISYDADEGLAPSDYGRLVSKEPVPDAALAAKQQLDHMVGAFGGLSEAHHQILVLRELEGLSYREIGERMGMTRPAVESTLFRARRRLAEEYDELASGQRCLRIQSIIATAVTGRLGARDTRRLARHVAHCQPCRRQALAAGVDSALVARRPLRQRAAEKVAALFPFPLLLGRRRGGGSGDAWAGQLPLLSDHAAAGGAKLAAVAALVVAGLGAGVGTQVAQRDDRPADRPARAAERTRAARERHRQAVTGRRGLAHGRRPLARRALPLERSPLGADRPLGRRQAPLRRGAGLRLRPRHRRPGLRDPAGRVQAPASVDALDPVHAQHPVGALRAVGADAEHRPEAPGRPAAGRHGPAERDRASAGRRRGTVQDVTDTVDDVTDTVEDVTAPVTDPVEDATGIQLPQLP